MKFKFRSEDFTGMIIPCNDPSYVLLSEYEAAFIEKANKVLQKKLAQAPVVYEGSFAEGSSWWEADNPKDIGYANFMGREAKLVDIRELDD